MILGENWLSKNKGVIDYARKAVKLTLEDGTALEYVTPFTQRSRYAPGEVDTDEKKQECFLNGL